MDMRRAKHIPPLFNGKISPGKFLDPFNDERKRRLQVLWLLLLLVGGSLFFPSFLAYSSHFRQQYVGREVTTTSTSIGQGLAKVEEDLTLGGLLPQFIGKGQCISRSQTYRLRRPTKFRPSAYLIDRLRRYEAHHRRCAKKAESFSETEQPSERELGDCQYIVWIAYSGLGNRIMTLASAFVYALLTDRVLLVDRSTDMGDLFCEPFPGAPWLLPPKFPYSWLQELNESSSFRFGHLIEKGISSSSHMGYAYVHLTHTYDVNDRKFFCEREQTFLQQFSWLFLKSNNYFVPGLYFLPSFQSELEKLFPQRETVFHHTGRYLFHPSNQVWGWILRFYKAYLESAEQQVGLQIRMFDTIGSITNVSTQIFSCAHENDLLPNVTRAEDAGAAITRMDDAKNPIAVLVTSLEQEYYERIREYYLDYPTEDGRHVGVHMPSHEREQRTEEFNHDRKAWADIYLLSLSDVLITSSRSTFGYAAQGLGGVRPWILTKIENSSSIALSGPCNRARSLEPCFHTPPLLDCDGRGWGTDPGKILPYVKHCEDATWGIKVVEDANS